MNMSMLKSCLVLCLVALTLRPVVSKISPGFAKRIARNGNTNEAEAKKWVDDYNEAAAQVFGAEALGAWKYNTNLTKHNLEESLKTANAGAKYTMEKAKEAKEFDTTDFIDAALKRQLSKIVQMGESNLPEEEYKKLSKLNADLLKIYSTAKVCSRPGDKDKTKCYKLDPDLNDIIERSENLEELEWAWKGWRDVSGKKMPALYHQYTNLQNKAAKNNEFADNGAYWRSRYESDTFREDCAKLINEIKPFYQQLHAYVRRKLVAKYKDLKFSEGGHIPAHILGNMWAQSWENLESLVKPEPSKPDLDITEELKKQGYTVDKIFKTSENFFTGLGMPAMSREFWDNSMMERPKDREVVCHASAWDFNDGKDFRIKQCTEVNQNWFMTTHHEMGHIAYYEQYKGQPLKFRTGANPGFHEAQADIASLSVATPAYLKSIGLIPGVAAARDVKPDLNFLMQQALTKIAFLPFGYMIDQWRWGVFDGSIKKEDYNKMWWENICKFQGLSPPVHRSDDDFDAGSKFHVANDTPYMRYFVAHIIQYQFHESLCKEAGHNLTLHQCSVHKSIPAGQKLMKMLAMGASKPWPEAMKEITGTEKMSANPLLHYFAPLIKWLEEQNKGEKVGWDEKCPPMARGSSGVNSGNVVLLLGMVALRFVGVF